MAGAFDYRQPGYAQAKPQPAPTKFANQDKPEVAQTSQTGEQPAGDPQKRYRVHGVVEQGIFETHGFM